MPNVIAFMFLLSLFSTNPSFSDPKPEPKHLAKNGMEVSWEIKNDRLFVEMSAPEKGWLAIGFNEKEGLKGTHLIMARIFEGQVLLSDRYILKPGMHKSMEELGQENLIEQWSGEETDKGTQISFSLPLNSADSYHKKLVSGQRYTMLLAYSIEDDFAHHSIMRTSVKIIL